MKWTELTPLLRQAVHVIEPGGRQGWACGHDPRNSRMATRLRFPVFIGSFTGEGEKALLQLRKRLPASLGMFLAEYHTKLGSAVIDDPRYELRLRVLQELAPKDPNVSRFSSPTSTT
jgi:hypothetical protein